MGDKKKIVFVLFTFIIIITVNLSEAGELRERTTKIVPTWEGKKGQTIIRQRSISAVPVYDVYNSHGERKATIRRNSFSIIPEWSIEPEGWSYDKKTFPRHRNHRR